MGSHEALKKQKERFAGDRFIILLNSEGGHNFIFKESPQKDPPDLIYEDMQASKTLLLEITAAYYNQKQAKWEWDIDRGIDTRKISPSPLIVEPDSSLRNFLKHVIGKKCQDLNKAKNKRPADFVHPVLLVITINAEITTSAAIQEFIDSCYLAPDGVPFQGIWLLLRETVGKKRMRSPEENIKDIPWNEIFGSLDRRFRFYPKH